MASDPAGESRPARRPAGLVFGIYPGGNLGTEDAEFTGPATRGPDDNVAAVNTALAQLHGTGPEAREFVVRGYVPFTDPGSAPHPEQPQELARFARGSRKVDLVVTYHSESGDVDGYVQFVREQVARFGDQLAVVQVTEEANLDLVPGTTDGCYPRVVEAIVAGVKAAREELERAHRTGIKVGFNCVPQKRLGELEPFHAGDTSFWQSLAAVGDEEFIAALDFVGIDMYPDVFVPAAPAGQPGDVTSQITENLRVLREELMPLAGIPASVDIHVTETGWPTGPDKPVEAQIPAVEAIVSAIAACREAYGVTHLEFFDLRDATLDDSNLWNGFGLVKADYAPKPAFATMQALIVKHGTPASPARHWPGTHMLGRTHDSRYRRMVVQQDRVRAGTLSFAPGQYVPEHAHTESDEVFFIISGKGTFVIEGEQIDVEPGDMLFAAGGERHAIVVANSGPMEILAVVTPNLLDAVASPDPYPVPAPRD